MTTKQIGYYTYEERDVVGVCPIDGGPIVDDPTLWGLFPLAEKDELDLLAGIMQIAFCPTKGHTILLREGVVLKVL